MSSGVPPMSLQEQEAGISEPSQEEKNILRPVYQKTKG